MPNGQRSERVPVAKKVNSVHVNTKKEIGDELEEQVLKELHDK